jgi:TetR/AcrR family tetracycline transcriptional repressor
VSLSKQKILDAAFGLLEEKGLAGLSLRTLADRLGVRAPSLSWHISNKATLMALMNQKLFFQALEQIPTCKTPSDWLVEFGLAIWRVHKATRDSAALINADGGDPAVNQEIHTVLITHLQHHDLDTPVGMQIQSSVQALIAGWSTFYQSQQMPYISTQIDFDESINSSLEALVKGMVAKKL